MSTTHRIFASAGLALLLAVPAAQADTVSYIPTGFQLTLGGGASDFTDENMRDMTGTAGAWNLRFGVGTRSFLGFEAAYAGSAQSIDALGLDTDAMLVANGLSGAVRVNLAVGHFQPFVFGGLGYKRYDIARAETNTSSIADSDEVIEIPVGAGFGYRTGGMVVELRGTYRPVLDDEMVPRSFNDDSSSLDSLELSLQAGAEF